jgi:hypothetical protein
LTNLLAQIFINLYFPNKTFSTTTAAWKVIAYFVSFSATLGAPAIAAFMCNTAFALADGTAYSRMRVNTCAFTEYTFSNRVLYIDFAGSAANLTEGKLG